MPMTSPRPLRIPHRLVADTRGEIRDSALRHLETLHAEHAPELLIDLADVREVDIGGIGILVLVQKRAQERGLSTRLLHAPVQVERMLALTQLDHLFDMAE